MVTPLAAALASGSSESETTVHTVAPGATKVALPDDFALAEAQFTRHGDDLTVTAPDGHQAVIPHYFANDPLPALGGGDGISLDGSAVARLAPLAPAQVAQAGAPAGEPIGAVDNISGTVTVIHADGSRSTLRVGDPVYQGDMLESGADGGVGIVFADETSFSMGPSGRMVLDEMIYDPAAGSGSLSVSLVHGLFSLVSGQIAKLDPDSMIVNTPVATIGIRGTQIGLDLTDGEHLTVVAMQELGGFVGEIVVRNGGGVIVLNQANQFTTVWGVGVAPTDVVTVSDQDLLGMFARALMYLPQANGNENNYGALRGEDLTFLSDFSTAAGGTDPLIGGSTDFIRVTNEVPTTFQPVPQVEGSGTGSPVDLGDGGDAGPDNAGDEAVPPPVTSSILIEGDEGPGFLVPDGFNAIVGTDGDDVLPGDGQDNAGNDYMVGGAGDDELTGGAGDDIVYGGDGDDEIVAGSGNGDDFYSGGNPPVELGGNAQDNDLVGDTVVYSSTTEGVVVNLSDDTVFVTLNDSTLFAVPAGTAIDALLVENQNPAAEHINVDILTQIEHVVGGSGRDTLIGSEEANRLFGEDGNDLLMGNGGDDIIVGGAGDDEIMGGAGDDIYFGGGATEEAAGFVAAGDAAGARNTINYSVATLGVTVTLAAGLIAGSAFGAQIGSDLLFDFSNAVGGAGDDMLTGNGGANLLMGGGGNDLLFGGGGSDTAVFSGNRADYTVEHLGDGLYRVTDLRAVGDGIDTVSNIASLQFADVTLPTSDFDPEPEPLPNPGQVIVGGSGGDVLAGGTGDDTIIGSGGNDQMSGGAGNDRFQVSGPSSGFDTISGGGGQDSIVGSAGDDVIGLFGTFGAGNSVETIDGGGGHNIISGSSSRDNLDFSATTLLNIDEIRGGGGGDTIIGTAGADVIRGGSGNDILTGGGGDDTFLVQGSGDGFDTVSGGQGADRILGSAGDDVIGLFGSFGPAQSVEVIDGGGGHDIVSGSSSRDNLDFSATTLITIAEIQGGGGGDSIVGSAGNDVIRGGAGNDLLRGGGGDDTFLFGQFDQGWDTVFDFGGTAGNADSLRLVGDFSADDIVISSSGNDRLQWSNAAGQTQTVELAGLHHGSSGYQVTETEEGVEITLASNSPSV